MAVYAVMHGGALGIDIEYVRPIPEIDEIATAFFSLKERAVLHTLPVDQRRNSFFRCWTRKEAYIKAVGDGLAIRLDQFEVTLAPGEPARLERIYGAPDDASDWQFWDMDVGPGFVSALAAKGSNKYLKCIEWDLLQVMPS
jgi:4'-phosphopantetheinyl transferase